MKKRLVLILGVVSLLVIIAAAMAALFVFVPKFQAYQQAVLTPPLPEIFVEIISPQNGEQTETGALVILAARPFSAEVLAEITFWINGVPVKVVPLEDIAPAVVEWIPQTEGEYSIVARATTQNGQTVDSDPVILFVADSGKTELVSQPLMPDLAYSGPVGENMGSSTVADPWKGNPLEWAFPTVDQSPPEAPGLSGTVEGCSVNLVIQDFSKNETGFRVYRNLPNIPGWKLVETLASNDASDALAYTDSGYYGSISYKVAAFNSMGESFSNLVSVQVNQEDCPAAASPYAALQVVDFVPKTPVDQFYCYYSLGGLEWRRWPSEQFISPLQEGFGGSGMGAGQQALMVMQSEMGGMQELPSLILDCWGWSGGELLDLGILKFSDFESMKAEPISIGNEYFDLLMGVESPETLGDEMYFGAVTSFLRPPVVFATQDMNVCAAKSDFSGDIPMEYCNEADGETPWPYIPSYLAWDLGDCLVPEGCLDFFSPIVAESDALAGAEWGYNVYKQDTGLVRSFSNLHQMVYAIPGVFGPPTSCASQHTSGYYVTSYFIPEGSQTMYEASSSLVQALDPCPAKDGVILGITFDNLVIKTKPEEPGEGEYQEVYATIVVYSGNMYNIQNLMLGASGAQIASGCPRPDSVDVFGGAAYGGWCPVLVEPSGDPNDIYLDTVLLDLGQAYLCQEGGLLGCSTAYAPQNNSIELTRMAGDTLTIHLTVMDHDENSADDVLCSVTQVFYESELGSDLMVTDLGKCILNVSVEKLVEIKN